MLDSFVEKLKNGKHVLGPFMKTGDPAFVEIAGYAGFDFVIIDMEHGPTNELALQNHIRAASCAGVLPIVRVGKLDEVSIARTLDVGALGVQVPQIETAEDAALAVRYAKYAPEGMRGVCRFVRAANYSAKDRFEYFKEANRSLLVLMLEGSKAIENMDSIFDVDGIDIVFIGPYDLSQSLGVPGQIDHPLVEERMRFVIEKAKAKGIVVGTFADQPATAKKWKDLGVQYIGYSVDVGIFYEACKSLAESI